VRLSGGIVTLQDAVDAFSARAACHVFWEAPRKFSVTPSRRPLRAAVASGATFPGCAPHQDRVARLLTAEEEATPRARPDHGDGVLIGTRSM
jgi:hypothetical protein